MKKFKEFINSIMSDSPMAAAIVDKLPIHGRHSKIPAVIVDALPVHGSHANKSSDIQEALEKDVSVGDFKSIHGLSPKEWNGLKSSYTPQAEHDDGDVHKSIKNYTNNSRINNELLRHATGKNSIFRAKSHHDYNSKTGYNLYKSSEQFDDQKESMTRQRDHLDHAISQNRLKREAVVYHGTGFHPGDFASRHPDRHIELPTYVSTSASRAIATEFARNASGGTSSHVLRIRLPKGHPALPILNRSEYAGGETGQRAEHEVLLPRNSRFKISAQPVYTSRSGGKTVHYWDAEPVQ